MISFVPIQAANIPSINLQFGKHGRRIEVPAKPMLFALYFSRIFETIPRLLCQVRSGKAIGVSSVMPAYAIASQLRADIAGGDLKYFHDCQAEAHGLRRTPLASWMSGAPL